MPDFTALRSRFPLLGEREYFASHSIGPPPVDRYRDIEEYVRSLDRGKRALPEWYARFREIVSLIESLLGAPPGTVALGESATAAQAHLASALTPRDGKNRIVITGLDFPSARYLWRAQVRRGFTVEEVESEDGGSVSAGRLVAAIDERTAIVAVSLLSWKTGALLDVEPVIDAARAAGAIVILDVYQAAGIVPIDVRTLDADAVVGGTVKWLSGSSGLAFLYVRPSLADALEPAYPGWFAHSSPSSFADVFAPAPGALRFQQGTPAVEPLYSARAGLATALEVGVENIRARSLMLTERMIERADHQGLHVRTPRRPEARGGVVCLDVPDPDRVVALLEDRGIDVDSRPGAGLRVAPHYCHGTEECQRVIDAIAALVRGSQ